MISGEGLALTPLTVERLVTSELGPADRDEKSLWAKLCEGSGGHSQH